MHLVEVGVRVGVIVGIGVFVEVGGSEGVGVNVGAGVFVGLRVGVGVGVGVLVGVGVIFLVGVGEATVHLLPVSSHVFLPLPATFLHVPSTQALWKRVGVGVGVFSVAALGTVRVPSSIILLPAIIPTTTTTRPTRVIAAVISPFCDLKIPIYTHFEIN